MSSSARPNVLTEILHLTDLSVHSDPAFEHSLALALLSRADLTVLHAGDLRDGAVERAFPSVRRTLANWDRLPPDAPASAVADLGITVRKRATQSSDLLEVVSEHLTDHPTNLIVLSTAGRHGLSGIVRPSVAETVVRETKAATLFLSPRARGFVAPQTGEITLRRVLIPVDSDPDATRAVNAAAALVAMTSPSRAQFTLLHVADGGGMPHLEIPEVEGITWDRMIRSGDPVEEIVKAAKHIEADLVAMATAGRNGFLEALRGSTTERVVRNVPCPVLAIPVRR